MAANSQEVKQLKLLSAQPRPPQRLIGNRLACLAFFACFLSSGSSYFILKHDLQMLIVKHVKFLHKKIIINFLSIDYWILKICDIGITFQILMQSISGTGQISSHIWTACLSLL